MQVWNVLHAARWKYRMQKWRKKSPSAHHRTTLSVVSSKLGSNISSTCPNNMENFGPLTAEIGSGVWGTPTNFNGFHVLPSLLQRRRSPEAGVIDGLCWWENQRMLSSWVKALRPTRHKIGHFGDVPYLQPRTHTGQRSVITSDTKWSHQT